MEAVIGLILLALLCGIFWFGISHSLDNPKESDFVVIDEAGTRHEKVEGFSGLPAPFSGVCKCSSKNCPLG